jgi:hypothetical protein
MSLIFGWHREFPVYGSIKLVLVYGFPIGFLESSL